MVKKGDQPVPGYRLEAFLGRGQFGEVWRASSPGGAQVALKFLNLNEKQGWKEFRGIQSVKSIRHPHLAPITALWLLDEAGEILSDDAVDGYSTDAAVGGTLVPGAHDAHRKPDTLIVATLLCDKSLSARLEECEKEGLTGIPVEELLSHIEEAAKGIDFLNTPHAHLGNVSVQHCDIKPDNIMLTGDAVMICDFGVARALADPRLAATGTSMAGSPAFMAPESIERKPGHSSDQYSLAVTYYLLRTGELPFTTESLPAVFDAKRSGKLDFTCVPEPEARVLHKATALDPDARYPSAAAMARALQEAVELGEEAPRPPRRIAVPVLIAAVLALATVAIFRNRIWPPVDGPVAGGTGAASVEPGTGEPSPGEPSPGEPSSGEPGPGEPGPVEPLTVEPSPEILAFRIAPRDAEVLVNARAVQPDGQGRIELEVGGDETFVIEARRPPEFLDEHTELTIQQLRSQTVEIRLRPNPVYHAEQAEVRLRAGPLDQAALETAVAEYRKALQAAPKKYSAVPIPQELLAHDGGSASYVERVLDVNPGGNRLIARSGQGDIVLAELESTRFQTRVVHAHPGAVNLEFKGSLVASGDFEEKLVVSVLDDQGASVETRSADSAGGSLSISPDSRWIVTGSLHGEVKRWQWSSGSELSSVTLGRHEDEEAITQIACAGDSRWAITSSTGGSVMVWQLDPPGEGRVLADQGNDVMCLALSPDGRSVAFNSEAPGTGHLVTLVDIADGRSVALPMHHSEPVSAVTFDSSSTWLASGSDGGGVQVGNVKDRNRPVMVPTGRHSGSVLTIAFCPLPGWLVTGGGDGTVAVWNLQAPLRGPMFLPCNAGRVRSVAVTSRWIIAGCENGTVLAWDLRRCLLIKQACDDLGIDTFYPGAGGAGRVKT